MNDQTFQDNKHNINYLENNFMNSLQMTESYNPKIVEKAAQSFWDEKIVLQQQKVKNLNIIVFQCFHIRLENCTWVMLEIIRLGM